MDKRQESSDEGRPIPERTLRESQTVVRVDLGFLLNHRLSHYPNLSQPSIQAPGIGSRVPDTWYRISAEGRRPGTEDRAGNAHLRSA
jgi:hypothetical protein